MLMRRRLMENLLVKEEKVGRMSNLIGLNILLLLKKYTKLEQKGRQSL